ncbi:TIGR02265 family protein [Vitiosangium sp. GDMCC 1.1324]|uniref:TIGR02265 family protein n=1 Tax=Vitiosangium sp. (strain GDMCC 1.1324) TaxID=2138576 RepID=UPI00130D66D4|nr:TIGR02265 family protein [Vitiosangium sp. GDMCC 1.1324]
MASNPSTVDLGSPAELERRLALIPPGDTARGYFFNCALEPIRMLGDAEALERCLETSGREEFTAFFNYPISTLLPLLYTAAWALRESSGSFEEALRQLGKHVAKHFLANPVGRALLMLAAKSPTQLVNGLPAAYRTGWGHGRGAVKWTGLNQCAAFIHGNVIPYPYFEGVFLEVFQAAGATGLKVTGRQVGPADTDYDISWS